MESYSPLLKIGSIPRMTWTAVSLLFGNLKIFVPVIILFSLPTDILQHWTDDYISSTHYSTPLQELLISMFLVLYEILGYFAYVAIALAVRATLEVEQQ